MVFRDAYLRLISLYLAGAEEQEQTGGLVLPNNLIYMSKNEKFLYMENFNLYGDENIQISVFALLSLKNMYH